jgi:hypothetical protein
MNAVIDIILYPFCYLAELLSSLLSQAKQNHIGGERASQPMFVIEIISKKQLTLCKYKKKDCALTT